MRKKIEERNIMFLVPMLGVLPDKLTFSFEVGKDEIAKFRYEEEFSSEELVKNSVDILKRMYDIPGMEIRQDGLKAVVHGEVPVGIAVGCVLGEVLAQAVYYLGKEKIQRLLDMFPVESDYVSRGKFTETLKVSPKEKEGK